MKDYSNYSVREACIEEMIRNFITAVKLMDANVAASRLRAIMLSGALDQDAISVLGQFISVVGMKTSADT